MKQMRRRGASLVEFAAAMSFGLPIIITILYVIAEASYTYQVKSYCDAASRKCARDLASLYLQDATTPGQGSGTSASGNVLMAQNNALIPHFVDDLSQFTVVWSPATPSNPPPTTPPDPPQTVTVIVTYPNGGSSKGAPLPWFMGSTFTINSCTSFGLE
jgi:hypothetical protein